MPEDGSQQPDNPHGPTAPTHPPVSAAVDDARRQAEATDADVSAFSASHLRGLLADKNAVLIERLDDPELTDADRNRLLSGPSGRGSPGRCKRPAESGLPRSTGYHCRPCVRSCG